MFFPVYNPNYKWWDKYMDEKAKRDAEEAAKRQLGPYFPLVSYTSIKGLCDPVLDVMTLKNADGKITMMDFLAKAANVCMIEAGMVPLTKDDKPFMPIIEYLRLGVPIRKARAIKFLEEYDGKSNYLRRIPYTTLVVKDKELAKNATAAEREKNLMFSASKASLLITFLDTNVIVLIAQGTEYRISLSINRSEYMNFKYCDMLESRLIVDFFREGHFDMVAFEEFMKTQIAYPVLDQEEGLYAEFRGLDYFANEILMNIASYLDVFSFVNFIKANIRIKKAVDNSDSWKTLYKRMVPDCIEKLSVSRSCADGLSIPPIRNGQIMTKEKYKAEYIVLVARMKLSASFESRLRQDADLMLGIRRPSYDPFDGGYLRYPFYVHPLPFHAGNLRDPLRGGNMHDPFNGDMHNPPNAGEGLRLPAIFNVGVLPRRNAGAGFIDGFF